MINDILDFSKIEAGKLSLDPIAVRPARRARRDPPDPGPAAHAKGLELACRIAPDVPDALVGDVGRLRQVLVNLVGNAIKFTERGEVVVAVVLEAASDGTGRRLRFVVADTGIGIPAEKLDAIFEPFEQADGSTTRRYGGTGLGLAISAKLVAMMGGQIWVESQPGRGSTFEFTVALGRAGVRSTRRRPSRPDAGPARPGGPADPDRGRQRHQPADPRGGPVELGRPAAGRRGGRGGAAMPCATPPRAGIRSPPRWSTA